MRQKLTGAVHLAAMKFTYGFAILLGVAVAMDLLGVTLSAQQSPLAFALAIGGALMLPAPPRRQPAA